METKKNFVEKSSVEIIQDDTKDTINNRIPIEENLHCVIMISNPCLCNRHSPSFLKCG